MNRCPFIKGEESCEEQTEKRQNSLLNSERRADKKAMKLAYNANPRRQECE
jgi:hypothetical protein